MWRGYGVPHCWLSWHPQQGASQLTLPVPHRVLTELVSKMRDMQMDKTELGCLRAIVLFNPGTSPITVGNGGQEVPALLCP